MLLLAFMISTISAMCPSNEQTHSYFNGTESSLKTDYETDGFLTGIKILEFEEMQYYLTELSKLESAVEDGRFVGQEVNPHLQYKFLWDIATHPKILSLVKLLFSDNIAVLATTLFTKYPDHVQKYVGYHQDVYYWGLDPPKAITIWFAFDNVTVDSGPMIFIPQTHTHNYEHQIMNNANNILLGTQEIPKHLFNESSGVPAIFDSGHMGIFHGKLIHGSYPNLSGGRRCGFVIRYIDLNTEIVELGYHNKDEIPEWRTPRILCGKPDKNIDQFYPYPNFVENPEIPTRISLKQRHFVANNIEQDQCEEM